MPAMPRCAPRWSRSVPRCWLLRRSSGERSPASSTAGSISLSLFPANLMLQLRPVYGHRADGYILGAFSLAVACLYYGFFEGRWGAAAGKALMGLRVVDVHLVPPGFRRTVARTLAFDLLSQLLKPLAATLVLLANPEMSIGVISVDCRHVVADRAVRACPQEQRLYRPARSDHADAGGPCGASAPRLATAPIGPSVISPRRSKATSVSDRSSCRRFNADCRGGAHAASSRSTIGCSAASGSSCCRTERPAVPAQRRDLGARRGSLAGRTARRQGLLGRLRGGRGSAVCSAVGTPQPWSRVRHWLSDLVSEIAAGRGRDRCRRSTPIASGSVPTATPGFSSGAPGQPEDDGVAEAASDLAGAQQFLCTVSRRPR